MKRLNKKGVLDNFANLVMGLAVFAIIASVIFLIIAESQDVIVDNQNVNEANASSGTWTAAYNASLEAQQAANDIPGWLPIIVVTVIGVAILGLVRLFRK